VNNTSLSAREQGYRKGFQQGFQAAVSAVAKGAQLATLYRYAFDELHEWRERAPENEPPPRAPLPETLAASAVSRGRAA
jgi:hypothetical protein